MTQMGFVRRVVAAPAIADATKNSAGARCTAFVDNEEEGDDNDSDNLRWSRACSMRCLKAKNDPQLLALPMRFGASPR